MKYLLDTSVFSQPLRNKPADLDLLIAATARTHGLTVATLNATDFSKVEGISWEN